MSIINSQPRIGAAGQSTGFKIERSLRFNSADSAYLNRTPSSTTNQKTFTWSSWVKLSSDTPYRTLFSSGTTVPGFINFEFEDRAFTSPDLALIFNVASGAYAPKTTAVFRDFSAWYHIVVAVDTTQATESNRVKLYVNGVQQTLSAVGIPQNTDLPINTNVVHSIGRRNLNSNPDNYFNGYITDVYLIDGSTPTTTTRTVGGVTETVLTQFGEFDTDTGVWKPKAYSGSYGTNGFYLKFADNSGTTSTTLGKDSSGNGNNWTPNNFSVTAGAGNDSLVDTPTPYGTDTGAGGEVRGNYCVVNPLDCPSTITLSNGNLNVAVASGVVSKNVRSTLFATTGKWYWETTVNGFSGNIWVGIATSAVALNSGDALNQTGGYSYGSNGNFYSGTSADSTPNTYTTNDVIGCAWNADSQTIQFFKNGVSEGTLSSLTAATYSPAFTVTSGSDAISVNFGQRPFAYTAPSGFKALCTQNLPTPTIGATSTTQAGKYFNTVTYSGTGATQSITSVGFQPDFIWFKRRDSAASHALNDSVRGVTKSLTSNGTDSEYTSGSGNDLVSFDSTGFTVGPTDIWNSYNVSGGSLVAWNWKANGAGSTNTAGTITSTVSANTTAGFSIVTYTGTGANATVGHGLGVAPHMIIIKRRDSTGTWRVGSSSLTSWAYRLNLDETAEAAINANAFNSTAPTSSVFSVGIDTSTNASTGTFVAYCFAPVAGYSAFGSYTGNGSTDGVFVYTGFRPRYILVKSSSNAYQWSVHDTARQTYNEDERILSPNSSSAEDTNAAYGVDVLSNGFKWRNSGEAFNFSGYTYIYAAFAENPFKYSLAR